MTFPSKAAQSHHNQLDSFDYAALREICRKIHQANVRAGWWSDVQTGIRKERNVGEMLMLCVSELAEAMEGHRKNLMDDKLLHRKMLEVELADTMIRICDLANGLDLDLPGAMVEKFLFNLTREDHKIENRAKPDGKQY